MAADNSQHGFTTRQLANLASSTSGVEPTKNEFARTLQRQGIPTWRNATFCALCKEPFEVIALATKGRAKTKDHIVPVSWGGPDLTWNYRATHANCNSSRGTRVGPQEVQDLAENLTWVVSPSYTPEDRLAIAGQILNSYREWSKILQAVQNPPEEGVFIKVPEIVREIRNGNWPWGLRY